MTDNWDRTIFDKELKSLLDGKLPVSASKITSLQTLATSHPQHHNYIIHCITRFIEKSPPDYRLAGLYVIDAISRVVHKQQRKREENNHHGPHELDVFLKRFAIVLKNDSLNGCFEPCSEKDKDKVKKTLDFWEQGNIYSKDVVQHVKHSFMTSEKTTDSTEKDDISSVDAASLLATLSNIGNGTLANLTIPGLNSPTPPPQQQQQQTEEKILPPALAKLLDGLVSSPSPTTTAMSNSPTPPLPVDPRIRPNNNDPRIVTQQDQPISTTLSSSSKNLKHWPPPQGPSITRRTERKSRWGHDEQQQQDPRLMNFQNTTAVPPPSFITPPSTSYHQQQQTDPFNDPTLPPGCIKVLTRTLFVGPIPDHYEEEDVSQLFSKYGELASVIVAKKIKGRHNAFLKFTTRASTQIAKEESEGLVVEAVPVKVNWAFGFGPKKHFNFDRGESIIPLAELSDEEKSNLVTAPVGGFQGQMLRDRTVIEEPEAQYRPEWKYDHPEDHQQQQQQQQRGGFKRHHQQQQQYDEGGFIRKRGRFNNINNRSTQANSGFYQQQQQQPLPPPPPPTFPTSNTNNNSYYNNRSSSTFPNNNIPQQQYYSNQQPY